MKSPSIFQPLHFVRSIILVMVPCMVSLVIRHYVRVRVPYWVNSILNQISGPFSMTKFFGMMLLVTGMELSSMPWVLHHCWETWIGYVIARGITFILFFIYIFSLSPSSWADCWCNWLLIDWSWLHQCWRIDQRAFNSISGGFLCSIVSLMSIFQVVICPSSFIFW